MGQTSASSKEPANVNDGFKPMEPNRRGTIQSGTCSDNVAAAHKSNVMRRAMTLGEVPDLSSKRPDTVDYFHRAAELRIPLMDGDTEDMAQRLVRAFEKGKESHRSNSPKDLSPVILLRQSQTRGFGEISGVSSPTHAKRRPSTSASVMLTTLRGLSAKMGCDIGGTLAKLVLMAHKAENQPLPLNFGKTGKMVPELEVTLFLGPPGAIPNAYQLKFLSGETQALEQVMQKFASVPQLPTKQMSVTGGGAHKFKDIFLEKLHLDFVPMKEMQSVVEGLRFVLQYQEAFSDSIFEMNPEGDETVTIPADEIDTEEFLLVNIGSGISVLKVTPDSFTRVGGSACGGATYVGLLRLLCDTTFQEGLRLAEKGNGEAIDTLVSDIYGKEGSAALGLAPDLTAANFGKLGTKRTLELNLKPPKKEDMSFACLQMVMQVASVLAAAFSSSLGISTIFFVGGFLSDNKIAEKRISKSMRSLKANAYFTRHCDFLGALGCLSLSIDEIEWEQSVTGSSEPVSSSSSMRSAKEE